MSTVQNESKRERNTLVCPSALDTSSKRQWPVSHVKPWPETHRERESQAAQETPSTTIWRLKQRGLFIPRDNLRGWPRIGMPGELL